MATAPKVSVGLGTKLGLAATIASAGLSAAVASGASLGVGAQTMAILSVVSALVTAAGRMVQSGWNTAPAVETDAGTLVPGVPAAKVTQPIPPQAVKLLEIAGVDPAHIASAVSSAQLPTDQQEQEGQPPA